jgi:hypothetical protein
MNMLATAPSRVYSAVNIFMRPFFEEWANEFGENRRLPSDEIVEKTTKITIRQLSTDELTSDDYKVTGNL